MFRKIKTFFYALCRSFLPFDCPLCGARPLDGSANMLCRDCFAQIEFVHEPFCPGCGGNLTGIFSMCQACMKEEARRPWSNAFTLFLMRGAGRELVHAFKYQNRFELARPLAKLAMMRCGSALKTENFDYIVPVPLHWTRRLLRGYNQTGEFSEALSALSGIPVRHFLKRRKRTKQQSKLSRRQRILNLKGAFFVKNSTNLKKRAILLVDDVITTGSTLAAAADALLHAGAGKVCIFTLARR